MTSSSTVPPPADAAPRPGRRRARRRRGPLVAGLVLVALGVGCLGWVGWELWGTNVVAGHRRAEAVAAVERAWDRTATARQRADAGGDATGVEVGAGTATALVRIPHFGDDYVVPVLEGTDDAVLATGYGHFTGSAGPGQVGNYALAAHRVTHGEPLRGMADLRDGDRVVVETRTHTYTYVLDTDPPDLRVPFRDGWVVEPQPVAPAGLVGPAPGESRLITLTTCAELFHTDDRLVAFGHLVRTQDRPAP